MSDPLANVNEPIGWAAIVTLAGSVLTMVASFGFNVTTGQRDAILGVLVLLPPLVIWLWARRHVTPVRDPQDNEGNRLVPERLT